MCSSTAISVWLESVFYPARIASLEIAVARQGPEREEFRIAVIVQIAHTRKATAGVMRLAPQAIGFLRGLQIIDATHHRRMIHLPRRGRARGGPGRRGRGGGGGGGARGI